MKAFPKHTAVLSRTCWPEATDASLALELVTPGALYSVYGRPSSDSCVLASVAMPDAFVDRCIEFLLFYNINRNTI